MTHPTLLAKKIARRKHVKRVLVYRRRENVRSPFYEEWAGATCAMALGNDETANKYAKMHIDVSWRNRIVPRIGRSIAR